MDIRPSPLDNSNYADFAWDRYRRLMIWMASGAFVSVLLGLGSLWLILGEIPIHMMIATSLGIFFSVLLAAALMGLVFLSAGSGHDDSIVDPFLGDEDPR
jgi:hypothetical protein